MERKGFDLAVRALVELPGTELVVVGGPPADQLHRDPEARRLRALAEELGVGDRLVLTGQRPHEAMPAIYRSADVVLAVPWYEPFGITPLEAAACGRPLVGAAVGGLLDSVDDEVTGHLVPPRDVAALADQVRRVLADPEEAAATGRRARTRAVALFDWAVVAARTEDVLRATSGSGARATVSGPWWLDDHALEVEDGIRSLGRAVGGGPVLGRSARRRRSWAGDACSQRATAEALPRPSTSPPSSWGGGAPTAGRCRRSRCARRPRA